MAVDKFGWIKKEEWVNGKKEKVSEDRRIDSIKPHFERLLKLDIKGFLNELDEARVCHCKKKEKAGDWGTDVHKAIEMWIKHNKEPDNLDEKGLEVFNKFKDWALKEKVEFLESEKHVWSEKYWIGGVLDLVIMLDGKKYIGDIKTSSGIYNEAFFQMGAYNLCLEEMGEHTDVQGYLVINLRKDGVMDMMMATDMEVNKEAFRSARKLYEIINKLKK
jgi:CRISPR/Cas system-associated exonuclease Cas4 (RecB family)